ncbi:hypothetical protein BDN72DRAFT_963787 [Pluteus cervinus]|uniref:Uncharacterized protein n=1 Tax=Pluteus cervinus TaxID=181527 RepID=A0ACD3ADG1_9AGAR|nr:hypothetical protein BDN72DRAFT_963787 [Pluteus cervinus]
MPPKALSNGTLSLRFMQNALRAKQQTQVEPERAEIHDDGKWEVAQDVRDAWGEADSSTTSTSKGRVTYETSYLPFLFPSSSDQEDGEDEEEDQEEGESMPTAQARRNKIQGRRVFGKKGKEIVYQDQTGSDYEEGGGGEQHKPNDSPDQTQPKSRVHPNPKPLNSANAGRLLSGLQEPNVGASSGGSGKDTTSTRPKRKTTVSAITTISRSYTSTSTNASKPSAREAIYSVQGTGMDLRQTHKPPPPPAVSVGFLKPSGVDDPNELRSHPAAGPTSASTSASASISGAATAPPNSQQEDKEIIQSARAKPTPKPKPKPKAPAKKGKRERESGDELDEAPTAIGDTPPKRRKKKKSVGTAAAGGE